MSNIFLSETGVNEAFSSSILDHLSKSSADAQEKDKEKLRFPFKEVPQLGQAIEVAEGILWARMPLPWSLDHINVYLFKEDEGWTVIDTGSRGRKSQAAWDQLHKEAMGSEPIVRVIVTHMHPDHIGNAGWLCEKHDAEFVMTQREIYQARLMWHTSGDVVPDYDIDFFIRGGMPSEMGDAIRQVGNGHFKKGVCEIPLPYRRIIDQEIVTFGNRKWRVVEGRGHSPEHACFECLDEPIFISGDQVLGRITANVSVNASEPEGNPLAHWIYSLNRMHTIAGDPMVLPSHEDIFYGLHERLNQLIAGHCRKLGRLLDRCDEPRSVVGTFKALFRGQLSGMDYFLGMGEATAHLRLLESIGLMARDATGPVDYYTTTGKVDAREIVKRCLALNGVRMIDLPTISKS